MHMTVPGTDRRFAALHNSGSSTPTSGRHAQAVSGYSSPGLATTKGDDRADCCSRHRHKGLASVRVRRDHDASRPPLLILIAAPFRIASPEMFPEAEMLPHLICSQPMFIGGAKDEADQHGGT